MRPFDSVVIGLGAMGAATLLALARSGQRVLGIDRFDPPHAMGSTHGETRITRCAIGEGAEYVPLVLRSHEIWREIEQETGEELLTQCGALILGGAGNLAPVHGKADFVRRTIETARACNIPHEELDAEAVMRRFPQFRLRGDEIAYFEPGGGFVRPERCVAAELLLARRAGAEIRTNTQVTGFARDGDGVCVTLQDGTRIIAGDAVLAAGAWSPGLAGPKLSSHLRVLRQTLHWFEPERPEDYAPERFPVFIWAHGGTENDSFYGFPIPHDGTGVKVACEQYCDALQNPDQVARDVPEFEVSAIFHKHVQGRLLGVSPVALDSKTCLYTMTPDGDFAIGCLPDNDRVLLVSACSGHGFKHSAGLGEAVAKTLISSDSGQLKNFALDRLLAYPSSAA